VEDSNDHSSNFDSSGNRRKGLPTGLLEIFGLGHCGWAIVVVPRGNTLGLVSDLDSQSIVN
jgi:hypothetical protein